MKLKDKNGMTEEEFLSVYDAEKYPRPSLTVDTVIFTVTEKEKINYRRISEKELKILLIKRGGHPFIEHWAIPGGFVNPKESTEIAAARELKEETGVENIYLEQLYTFSDPNRDPRTRIVSCSYIALVDSKNIKIKAGDDAKEARWFNLSLRKENEKIEKNNNEILTVRDYLLNLNSYGIDINTKIRRRQKRTEKGIQTNYRIIENIGSGEENPNKFGLAFDHAKIITMAIERLRGKVEYTDIALNLLPEYFTLTELQQVYEIILDKPLLKAAFRRKYGKLAVETDKVSGEAGHRPSKLYKRKWLLE